MQEATPKRTRIAHVGIALESVEGLVPFFRDVLGMEEAEVSDSDGAHIVAFDAGDSLIELMEPEARETPIGRFIARRGPGIHHLCFAVSDLGATLERCREAGIRLIDEKPRIGAEGKLIAFLHPGSTGGILVEVSEY